MKKHPGLWTRCSVELSLQEPWPRQGTSDPEIHKKLETAWWEPSQESLFQDLTNPHWVQWAGLRLAKGQHGCLAGAEGPGPWGLVRAEPFHSTSADGLVPCWPAESTGPFVLPSLSVSQLPSTFQASSFLSSPVWLFHTTCHSCDLSLSPKQ